MNFATLPPEINSGRMYEGPGSGTMTEAATAWDRLAIRLLHRGCGLQGGDLEAGGAMGVPSVDGNDPRRDTPYRLAQRRCRTS